MSRAELYQWHGEIEKHFKDLGRWQALGLAMYSYGVVQGRACAPSRVAEHLPEMGKVSSVQRRLERWLDNERIDWQACCQAWAKWVFSQYQGERVLLLVDETKLGQHLSAMVVGLAYRGCCIPVAFWCYAPKAWPMGQVELIATLLQWIAPAVPPGVIPLVQADRGIGTSPDLLRVVEGLGWHYLFRVQKNTRLRDENGAECPLASLVTDAGMTWKGSGQVFKKAGWLHSQVQVIWGRAYKEAWCLVTNAPEVEGWLYGRRYWQEASFRDLKSDGWQWQTSRVWSPDHAQRLLLVLALAYAWMLSLGTLAFDLPDLRLQVVPPRSPLPIFRLGLRLWLRWRGQVLSFLTALTSPYLRFVDSDPPSFKTVGL